MSLIGRVFRTTENLLPLKNWSFASAVLWNEGVYFSKKVELPVPPKRPLTAYMLFVKEKRQELLKETPVLSSQEQIKLLAKRWMSLPVDSKKPYELQARQSTLLYGEEHKKYFENLSEQQKEELKKQKSDKRKARRLYRLNKALQESGLPKHPRSPFALFVHSLANNDKSEVEKSKDFIKNFFKKWMLSNEASEKDFLKQAAEKWKLLSEEEKKPYEKQAADDKERYQFEIVEWKDKLVKEKKEKLLKSFGDLKYGGKSIMDKTDEGDVKKVTKTKKAKSSKKVISAS